MNVCKKCNQKFPNRTIINGKSYHLHRRAYCLNCSPIGTWKGRNLRRENNIKNIVENGRPSKKCPICSKIFKWTKNDICTGCRTAYRRHINKSKAFEKLGNCCKLCGCQDKDVLCFHHKPNSNKLFTLCEIWQLSWGKIEKELDKCELLCYHCHIKWHITNGKNNNIDKILSYYGCVGELAYPGDLKSPVERLTGSSPVAAIFEINMLNQVLATCQKILEHNGYKINTL